MKKFFTAFGSFVLRFPALLALGVVSARIAYGMAFDGYDEWIARYKPVALAMAVSVAIQAVVEVWRDMRKYRVAGAIASLAVGAALYSCFMRIGATGTETFMIRYYLLFASVLSVFAYCLSFAKGNGDKMPMLIGAAALGFLVSLAFCGVVCAIVVALEKLFGVDVRHRVYDFVLYMTLTSIFPLVFTAFAFQRDFHIPPKTHRVVFEYFLLPVLLVNLLILWVYLIKVMLHFTLPKGGLTWLVSLACAIWMLTYAIFTYSETRTAHLFRCYAGFLVVPLLVLQAIALHVRISAYGITPERYLAVLYSLFVVFFLATTFAWKGRYQRVAYLAFTGLALFAALSPWSAIAVSVRSQQRRIEAIYRDAGLFKDGKIVTKDADWKLSDGERQNVLSAGHFLFDFKKVCGIYVKTRNRFYHQFVEQVALEQYGIDVHSTIMDRKVRRGEMKRPAPAPHSPLFKTTDLDNKNPLFGIETYDVAYFVEFKSKEDNGFRWTWRDGKLVPCEKPSFVVSCDTNVQEIIEFDANILMPQLTMRLRGEAKGFDPVPIGDGMALLMMTCHLRYGFRGQTEEVPTEENVTIGTLSGKGILLGPSNIWVDLLSRDGSKIEVPNMPSNTEGDGGQGENYIP